MPKETAELPFFLTREVATRAFELAVLPVVKTLHKECVIEFPQFHLLLVVPAVIDGEKLPHELFAHSEDDPRTWEYPFDDIARSKARELWYDLHDGGSDCLPHLLFPQETPYWGGVKRHGLVAACSGFKPHIDRMLSGIMVDTCVALSYGAWKEFEADLPDTDFLPAAKHVPVVNVLSLPWVE